MILRSFQPDSLSCCRLYSDGLELGSDLCLPAVVLWNSAPHVSTMLRSNLDLSDSVLDILHMPTLTAFTGKEHRVEEECQRMSLLVG